MENNSSVINRYSDGELLEFKKLVEQKLEASRMQLKSMTDRVENISESSGNDGDWMDDSSNMQDLDMLNVMIGRQRKHVRDLENALIRISNKRFRICVVTGELIDKRRLIAVPTTTKSLAAKTTILEQLKQEAIGRRKLTGTKASTSFSKVIKRTGGVPTIKPTVEKDNFFDDDDDNEDKDDGFDEIETIDLDSIVDESTETDY